MWALFLFVCFPQETHNSLPGTVQLAAKKVEEPGSSKGEGSSPSHLSLRKPTKYSLRVCVEGTSRDSACSPPE